MHLTTPLTPPCQITAERLLPVLASLRAARRSDLERITGAACDEAALGELVAGRILDRVQTPAGPLLTLGTRAHRFLKAPTAEKPNLPTATVRTTGANAKGQGAKRHGPLAHPLLAWGFHRAALRAAHIGDGFAVGDACSAREVLLASLVPQQQARRDVAGFRAALERWRSSVSGFEHLPFDIAWQGTSGGPRDVRILFVEHPFRALHRQLALLPLDIHGLAPIDLVLRPQDDGSVVDKHTGRPLWKGPRWLRLERHFQETARPTSFPFWETTRLVTYRPELFYRAVDPKTWNRWSQR